MEILCTFWSLHVIDHGHGFDSSSSLVLLWLPNIPTTWLTEYENQLLNLHRLKGPGGYGDENGLGSPVCTNTERIHTTELQLKLLLTYFKFTLRHFNFFSHWLLWFLQPWSCIEHKIKLNPNKCKEMYVIFTKNSITAMRPTSIGNQEVERLRTYKLSGVMISDDLKWNTRWICNFQDS